MKTNNQLEILKIVFWYTIFGCIWIYFSDSIVNWFVHDPDIITIIAISKGTLFIFCTALLLYILIYRFNTKISESSRAQLKSDSHFKTLVQTIPDLVWLKDENGVYLSCNLRFELLYGAKQDEIIGKNDYDFVDKELAEFFREHDRKAILAGGPSINEEWVTYASDGHRALLETIKTPMYDNTGKLIGILGVGRDITDRKRMEDQLHESEDRFRMTFNSSPDAININRLDGGQYIDVNEGFTRITGYSREDVLGKTPFELNIWADKADQERLMRYLSKDSFCENLEAMFQKKDGSLITGLMSARVISINEKPHVISITRDISEHKKYEKEILKIEKLESLGILAGGIAHDFNNILTAIMGNISLAQLTIDEDNRAHTILLAAEKAAARAGELSHQLLTFAKGGEPIKKVVLPRLIVEESLTIVLSGSAVRSVVDIDDTVHAFEADEGQISQVIRNLALNAMQAMPEGGTLTVKGANVTLEQGNSISLPAGDYVRLTFEDQGCGIPKENLAKIFDPYFTTKPSGNGLGLASVFSIITRHGGHISVDSEAGVGTTFTLFLPSIGNVSATTRDDRQFLPKSCQSGERVLVLDDEQLILDIAESILLHLGYQVTTCTGGEEVIHYYKEAATAGKPFSFAILDLTIPGKMGGKQAAEHILKEFPDACLIVSSGYSNDPVMSHFRDCGFKGAITKPYSVENFSKSLKQILSTA